MVAIIVTHEIYKKDTVDEVHVSEMDGMLALSGVTGGTSAVTIGHYSLGPKGYVADWRDHLFVHEYGHYIQSQRFGLSFLPVIGIPSLLSAWKTSGWENMEHRQRWFEVDASYLGAKHFDKKYGSGANGYKPGSENFFDINSFQKGGSSPYINPRYGTIEQDKGHYINNSKLVFWDFIL